MNLRDLKKDGIDVQENIALSKYTFTKTGGRAEFLAFPKSVEELKQLIKSANDAKMPITVIGNASNLIIRDGGIDGLVIILTKMKSITVNGDEVTAQAGARIIDTAFTAANAGLSGLEFAAGIPGSVGGAVFMNAGAYGGETKDAIKTVTVLTSSDEIKTYTNEEMEFSYRHSRVQENDDMRIPFLHWYKS